ncbi:protein TolA [Acidovorax sp. SRB_14]|uniref:cell envelope integrity protein TolA n=1 Tax=Acidovorax sp. SRB_14 TaxID=1962699 RepID=UPI0015654F83|nr:cell envelope integrity protein TolA [Acidovorax sp. SRB_14]NMM82058.1 protein TolA [Acidovorax sp. SRB_14]
MQFHDDRDQFAPPRPPARLRAVVLAVLVHAMLIGALTWGVNWKSESDQPAVEAQLWSAVPQQAAPRAAEPPAPTPQPPEPVQPAPPPPPPPPPPEPRQAEPDTRAADIAVEREKKRLEKEKKERQQQLERDKREKERKEEERRDRLEQEKKERLQKEKIEQLKAEKAEKAEREKERLEKLEKQKQAAEDKKRQAQEDQRKQEALEKASAKAAEARRQENIRRMQGLAGATGGDTATGSAKQDSGPSGSYGGRVAAKVKPNIVYPDAVSGNPRAVVQVRAAPDGTIVGTRLVQSSGNKAWDDAVLRALDKTETLPRDVDGRVPSALEIGFRPKD